LQNPKAWQKWPTFPEKVIILNVQPQNGNVQLKRNYSQAKN